MIPLLHILPFLLLAFAVGIPLGYFYGKSRGIDIGASNERHIISARVQRDRAKVS